MAHRTALAKWAIAFGIVGTALLTLGCGDRITCAGVGLAPRVRPADTTIRVGESFLARYEESPGTCNPGQVTDADYHAVPVVWRTVDTVVIRLDASGRVTGRAVGDARVAPDIASLLSVVIHVR